MNCAFKPGSQKLEKENILDNNEASTVVCSSPSTQSAVSILLSIKDDRMKKRTKSKTRSLILTENSLDRDDEEWRPPVTSPLKLAIPITNSTKFHFGFEDEKSDSEVSVQMQTKEILTQNSNNSVSSASSSLSNNEQLSRKREGILSEDTYYSKVRKLPAHPRLPPSFTIMLTNNNSQDSAEYAMGNDAALRSIANKVERENSPTLATTPSSAAGCTSCNCRKSHCLKLYCECFKNRGYCSSDCNCLSCYNNIRHEEDREDIIQTMLTRNPRAFDSHVDKKKGVNRSGCRCRKTRCDKRYCECFNSGVPCGEQCQCINCCNQEMKTMA